MLERWRRRGGLIAAVVAVALVAGACSDDSGPSSAPHTASEEDAPDTTTTIATFPPADEDPAGTYGVGKRIETFVDSTRPTPPNNDYPGAPDRTLETAIYYPADVPAGSVADDATPSGAGPFPLVLFSHGYLGTGPIYEQLIRAIASGGYVVAAPDYPLSNGFAPGGPVVTDLDQQPADASFVIDSVLALNDQAGDPLAEVIDPEHIGAAGHSLGGFTTIGLVYSECCRDDRIDAAIPMSAGAAGIEDVAFGEVAFDSADTPLLFVHGTIDDMVPYDASVEAFELALPPKFLFTYVGGGHIQPYLGGDYPAAEDLTNQIVNFFDAYLKGDPKGVARLESNVRSPAFETLESEPS